MLASTNRWGLKVLLVCLSVWVLSACSSLGVQGPQPVQSPNDDYQYRYLVLENDLQVLLISDPDTPKAAASLDVMVGSGDNPPGRGGLAHFLEHMLFLGTDKYPDAAEYEQYITEHGGSRNAYTSLENTNYFFDIDADHLPEALDRFAQFFVAPRFDAEYVEREKNAVEAEYQMGLKSDGRRGLDVLQEVMNPQHPFSQFAVGSLETLNDRPEASVRDDLLEFYAKHYSANVMRLVVLGSESLEQLEALVRPMFSEVPNRNYQPEAISEPLFLESDLPLLVQVEPQATLRQLQVNFPIDDYRPAYRAKPGNYLSNLLGHEGSGSLLSQLKAEGLAESLAAGQGLGWRGGSLLSVTVSLTDKGAANYERVLQLLFAYADMLRESGPQQWLYQEQAALAELAFRFREQTSPMGYVTALSSGMHYYSPEDILQGPYVMEDYQPDMLDQLLDRIRPENAMVVFTDESAVTERSTRYYQVPYSATTLSPEALAKWRGNVAAVDLALPAPNEFIAGDVSLVELSRDNPQHPTMVLARDRQTVWFQQDEEFRIPKGATYINFRSPLVGQSAGQTAAAVLYTSLLKDSVNEFTYPALLAGLSFNFYKHAQGISLRISGYSDKQPVLLDRLLAVISEPDFDPQRFENIRTDMIRSLENSVAKRPSSQVIDDLRESLLYGEWGEQPVIDALRAMTLADVEAYAARFWASATAESLVFGNYDPSAASSLADAVAVLLADGEPPELPDLEVLRLAAGESLQYAVDVPHDDSVVAWYLQAAGNSYRDQAAAALAGQVTKSGFFQQLRTEQQLGYVVSSFAWPQLDVPGIVLLIQSPSHSAPEVVSAMEAYMSAVPSELDAAQFERHKAALINDIMRPDKNMWERAEFYWQSIAKKQFEFDGKQRLADAVSAFTMADWVTYFERVFLQQRHSLLVVAPGKWQQLPDIGARPVADADSIKARHATYVIH